MNKGMFSNQENNQEPSRQNPYTDLDALKGNDTGQTKNAKVSLPAHDVLISLSKVLDMKAQDVANEAIMAYLQNLSDADRNKVIKHAELRGELRKT